MKTPGARPYNRNVRYRRTSPYEEVRETLSRAVGRNGPADEAAIQLIPDTKQTQPKKPVRVIHILLGMRLPREAVKFNRVKRGCNRAIAVIAP